MGSAVEIGEGERRSDEHLQRAVAGPGVQSDRRDPRARVDDRRAAERVGDGGDVEPAVDEEGVAVADGDAAVVTAQAFGLERPAQRAGRASASSRMWSSVIVASTVCASSLMMVTCAMGRA